MEPPPPPLRLPSITDLTAQHIGFLDRHLRTQQDLTREYSHLLLSSSLTKQCSELHSHLLNRLTKRSVSWIHRSFKSNSSFQRLTLSLQNLSLLTSPRPYQIIFIYTPIFIIILMRLSSTDILVIFSPLL